MAPRLLVFLLALVCALEPAQAQWRRAESPHFIVYSQGPEADLRERTVLLERFDGLLRMATNVSAPPGPNKLTVYLVEGTEDLRIVRPGSSALLAGFYSATPNGIAAFVDRRLRDAENEILFHEYAHHFMMQHAAGAYPVWYVEGFAEYFATTRFHGPRIEVGNASAMRGDWVVNGRWLPMERVLFGSLAGLNAIDVSQFYAQSWLIVHYFFRTEERRAALRRYLAAARDADPRQAFEQATGFSPSELAEELRGYIRRGRISFTTITLANVEAPPSIAVTTLPRTAGDLILYEAALRRNIEGDAQARLVRRIREQAARRPQDPVARRTLAHAEILYGDAAAADPLLDPLIAAAPEDAELMYLKGLRYLMAAERGQDWATNAAAARRWFVRAHRAAPYHYQTLYRYSQSMRREADYFSDQVSEILLLAHELAPQVSEIRLNAAVMQMNRGAFTEAEGLLRPIANDPHDPQLAQTARELLEHARARRRPQPAQEPRAD
ncbi:MAG: hypothetical protein M3177_01785 [Pseudomonadota bacterium]|nr:hypothetical protein [Pseudomonadota bacterium]